MKRLFLLFLTLISLNLAYAQVSYGTYVYFPKYSFASRAYLPQLAVGKVNDQYLLVLKYTTNSEYASFDQGSQLLLKINDEIIHVPMSKVDTKVQQDFKTLNGGGYIAKLYTTYTSFDIEKDVLERIVKNGELISKIRIIFTNGDVKDYEIKEKNQKKLTEGLKESYETVEKENANRQQNIDNDEQGF